MNQTCYPQNYVPHEPEEYWFSTNIATQEFKLFLSTYSYVYRNTCFKIQYFYMCQTRFFCLGWFIYKYKLMCVLSSSEKHVSWCIISALADIMKKLLTKYDNLFEVSFPYSMGWHGECSVWIVVQSLRRINVPMFVYVSSNFNLQIPLTIQLLTL